MPLTLKTFAMLLFRHHVWQSATPGVALLMGLLCDDRLRDILQNWSQVSSSQALMMPFHKDSNMREGLMGTTDFGMQTKLPGNDQSALSPWTLSMPDLRRLNGKTTMKQYRMPCVTNCTIEHSVFQPSKDIPSASTKTPTNGHRYVTSSTSPSGCKTFPHSR